MALAFPVASLLFLVLDYLYRDLGVIHNEYALKSCENDINELETNLWLAEVDKKRQRFHVWKVSR